MAKTKKLDLKDHRSKDRMRPVGVTLSDADFKMLEAIQRNTGMSRSAAIRACVHKVYASLKV